MPDCYESGTPNTAGLAGLKAGLEFIEEKGCEKIFAHEQKLAEILRQNLNKIPDLTLFTPKIEDAAMPVVSFTLKGINCSEIGYRLDRDFSIMTRVGLHCAPRAHQNIATFQEGTVRLAPGFFNSEEDMKKVITAIAKIA
jgi:selenocysteine lyase/cysteine desulfurase